MTDPHAALRRHLLELLDGGSAHARFEEVIKDWPAELQGRRPHSVSHSPWEVLEHIRLCQWDILEFSRDAKHESPPFPEGYWPDTKEPPTVESWERSVAQIRFDLDAMKALVSDPEQDLFKTIPWGTGQTLMREAMVVADHNAYHLGELMTLRRLLRA